MATINTLLDQFNLLVKRETDVEVTEDAAQELYSKWATQYEQVRARHPCLEVFNNRDKWATQYEQVRTRHPCLEVFNNRDEHSAVTNTLGDPTPTRRRTCYVGRIRRGSRGGGKGALALPPIFWGKNKGAGQKPHTHKKKIKIGQPRSKIQAKMYPKTH